MKACPTPPTPGGSAVARANVTSTSGQGAADVGIGGHSSAAPAVITATPSEGANRRAILHQMLIDTLSNKERVRDARANLCARWVPPARLERAT